MALWAIPIGTASGADQHLTYFDIPAGFANDSLTSYARQSDRQVLFPYDVVSTIRTNKVVGNYSATEALSKLLAETVLTASEDERGRLTISFNESKEEESEMNTKNRSFITKSLIAVASLFSASGAVGQPTNNLTLEEIVVTARKVSESMQDVPISVQAFTGDSLTAAGLSNISEIGNLTSNMEFDSLSPINGSSNTPNINIRGIGTTDFLLTVDPSVGVYVDGVYVARSVGGLLDLLDLEQIEVLKGPQGTLFGRNTIAGAVLLTSKAPSAETNFGAEVIAGEDSRLDIRLKASGALTENLFVGATFSSKNRDGYGKRRDFFADNPGLTGLPGAIAAITAYDEPTGALLSGNTTGLAPSSLIAGGNITAQPPTSEEPGNENTDSARVNLLWEASETTQLRLIGDYSKTKETAPALVLLDIFGTDPSAGGAPNVVGFHSLFGFDAITVPFDERFIIGDKRSTYATGPGFNESETTGISLTIDHTFSNEMSFKSITAYRDLDALFGQDPDHSPFTLDNHTNDFVHEQFSQEFQLTGSTDRLNWVTGIYYAEEEGTDRVIVPLLHGLITLDQTNTIDNTAAAIFGQGTYKLSDATSLTAGIRYTDEEKNYNQIHLDCGVANAIGVAPGFVVDGCNSLSTGTATTDFENTSYNLNLSHRFNEKIMTYLSFSTGYKSGGFSGRTVAFIPDQTPIPFDEEEAETFEIGFKSDFWDSRIRLNGALFSTDYTGLQLTIQSSVAPITANAGKASINGLELDMTALLSDRLKLTAALGLLDGEYDESPSQVGDNLVNAPDSTLNLGLDYDLPLSNGSSLVFRGDYTYKDEVFNNTENTPLLTQSSIGLLDASVSWGSADQRYAATLGAKNITDEEYLITGFFQPGVGYIEGVYARGTEWYLSLKYGF